MNTLTVLYTAICLLCASPISHAMVELSGHYRCTGIDTITKQGFDEDTTVIKTGNTYKFVWTDKDKKIFYGTGILNGENISIVFWDRQGTKGVVTYHREPSGNLTGRWAISDSQLTGDEFCERLNLREP